MAFLSDGLEFLKKTPAFLLLPPYISQNLSPTVTLRDYQEEALRYFITCYENPALLEGKQPHLLFHMATGSGKTVIMAALILYLYRQGLRNFVFFVNSGNVLTKTKENFLNPLSSKYLFAPTLELDGQSVHIRAVDNFQAPAGSDIQICFTTIQKLHLDLQSPREDGLSLEDFTQPVVFLSDEAHHVNTLTKAGKADLVNQQSWEGSVNRAFRANRGHIMLEFTATCDLKDPNVLEKYQDKLLFDYPLAKFRSSGYTKDFQNLQSGYDLWGRTLCALVLSQYRLMLFADAHQTVKPVVLLKSQRIAESQAFYEDFFRRLEALTGEDLAALDFEANPALRACRAYLDRRGFTLDMLAQSLKLAFSRERAIIMNGSTDNSEDKQLAVNSLEDPKNPYRIIFTVDMLNEGWDVLNLFDIVRLYETRQSSGHSISPYTIQEAQLIGRGARYCPFRAASEQERYRRKYDDDLANPMRICETLYYHSKSNSRYIDELRTALTELGLLPTRKVEVALRLKENFQATDFYRTGYLFANRREEKGLSDADLLPESLRSLCITVTSATGHAVVYDLFSSRAEGAAPSLHRHSLALMEVPWSIAFDALCTFDTLRFDRLKARFPHLKSSRQFVTDPGYLGGVTLNLQTPGPAPTGAELRQACLAAFSQVAAQVEALQPEYRGTRQFFPLPVREVLTDKVRLIEDPHGDGEGISQRLCSPPLQLDLSRCDWYVFEDNFGTTEEKKLVLWFSHVVEALQRTYGEVYLIRNERFPQLALYTFEAGQRFEPDYLLLLRTPLPEGGYLQRQLFLEPKGEGFRAADAWKEDFLLRLETEAQVIQVCPDHTKYQVSGLPFFTEGENTPFTNAMKAL